MTRAKWTGVIVQVVKCKALSSNPSLTTTTKERKKRKEISLSKIFAPLKSSEYLPFMLNIHSCGLGWDMALLQC
jgi:hypothetical protein